LQNILRHSLQVLFFLLQQLQDVMQHLLFLLLLLLLLLLLELQRTLLPLLNGTWLTLLLLV